MSCETAGSKVARIDHRRAVDSTLRITRRWAYANGAHWGLGRCQPPQKPARDRPATYVPVLTPWGAGGRGGFGSGGRNGVNALSLRRRAGRAGDEVVDLRQLLDRAELAVLRHPQFLFVIVVVILGSHFLVRGGSRRAIHV